MSTGNISTSKPIKSQLLSTVAVVTVALAGLLAAPAAACAVDDQSNAPPTVTTEEPTVSVVADLDPADPGCTGRDGS